MSYSKELCQGDEVMITQSQVIFHGYATVTLLAQQFGEEYFRLPMPGFCCGRQAFPLNRKPMLDFQRGAFSAYPKLCC